MNDRIKQLAEQSSGTRKYVPPVWQFFDDELNHFAESIIRECVEVCNAKTLHYSLADECAEDIKTHFGIK